jgi:hypothetical protein
MVGTVQACGHPSTNLARFLLQKIDWLGCVLGRYGGILSGVGADILRVVVPFGTGQVGLALTAAHTAGADRPLVVITNTPMRSQWGREAAGHATVLVPGQLSGARFDGTVVVVDADALRCTHRVDLTSVADQLLTADVVVVSESEQLSDPSWARRSVPQPVGPYLTGFFTAVTAEVLDSDPLEQAATRQRRELLAALGGV